jgi:Ser/Thr protein kinase RdoA (MazF antagonist)
MTVPAEAMEAAQAEAVALAHWNIRGKATLLTGERDRNFRLTDEAGAQYVLKFANPAEDPAVTDFQIRALQHIAFSDPEFPVPRIIPRPGGEVEARLARPDGSEQRVRLLSWLEGAPLRLARRSLAQREACGRALARLGLALRGFRHPAARHELIWDLAHMPRLRELLYALEHTAAEDFVGEVLDNYDARISPILPGLRHQVLHNDMNLGNTLMDASDPDRLVGIIDFGDMVETALAIDVAVGAASQIDSDVTPAEAMTAFLSGYTTLCPLTREEAEAIVVLVPSRLCLSLVLTAWHRGLHPDNPHYQPITNEQIERRLALIRVVREPATSTALRRACGFS